METNNPLKNSRLIIAGIVVLLLIVLGYFYFKSHKNVVETPIVNAQASISGKFNLEGDPAAGTTLSVAFRKNGDQNFTIAASNLSPKDQSAWTLNNVTA